MVAGFYACSSDDYEEHVSTLKVIESDLTFSNKAGSGYVEVESPTAITAKSSDDWCTATVNGTRVDVTVTSYPDIEARNAQIVIYNATDSVKLPVYQSGAIFSISADESYLISPNGEALEISAKITKDYKISLTDDSWVHYTVNDRNITFTFDENEGSYRSSQFKITSVDGDEESVWFGQLGPEGFAGNYIAFFQAYNSNSVLTWYYTYASISNEGNDTYNINDLVEEGPLPMTYSSSTNMFEMKNGSYVGEWQYSSTTTYYLYVIKNYTNAAGTSNYITYNTTSDTYSIYFTPYIETEDGSLCIEWTKSPSLSSSYIDLGLIIRAMKIQTFASANSVGSVYTFRHLTMYSL